MVTAELIYEKAKKLDSTTLELIDDFMEFIAVKQEKRKHFEEMRRYFPLGKIESPEQKPPYITRTVSLEEMDAAIDYEASLRK